jgi:hypothetical protein
MAMDSISKIHQIQEILEEQKIIFCYSGYVTESVLLGVGETIKKKMELVHADRKSARVVFAIFVEEVQNIIRYSDAVLTDHGAKDDLGDEELDGEVDSMRRGFVAIGNAESSYFVCCGNLVKTADMGRLENNLKHIQSLDEDGLKTLYKETLRNPPPDGSKGAGVGFVDIARRARGGFEYSFKNIDDAHAYFYFKAYA